MTSTLERPTASRAHSSPGAAKQRSAQGQRVRGKVVSYVVMSLLAVLFLFPLVFMFVSSLKPDSQILQDIDSPNAFLPVGDISPTTTSVCSSGCRWRSSSSTPSW